MRIECTVEELKELIKRETPVAGTTDAKLKIDGQKVIECLFSSEKYQS